MISVSSTTLTPAHAMLAHACPIGLSGAHRILTWICLLVIEPLGKLVVSTRDRSTQEGADPVDPVVAREMSIRDCWTKGAGRVEGTAGEEDA